ncbi:hypothetical protein LTR81_012587 [Elasticomyces elasticus]
MVCQQIRLESGELFYNINTFSFSGSSMFSDHANLAGRFLRGIGHRNTLAMRSILFDLDTIHSVYESTTDLTLMRDFANSKLQIDFRCFGFISLPNPPYAHKLDLDIRNLTASFANQRRPIRTHFKEAECPMEQADPETATGEWENMYRLDQEFADGMVIWSRQEEAKVYVLSAFLNVVMAKLMHSLHLTFLPKRHYAALVVAHAAPQRISNFELSSLCSTRRPASTLHIISTALWWH